jgi:hypothetical protein
MHSVAVASLALALFFFDFLDPLQWREIEPWRQFNIPLGRLLA